MSFAEIFMSLELGLIYGVIALGIYLTFRVIDFPDLTCDGSFVLGAACSGMLIKAGCNPYLSLVIAMLAGACAGITTGILHIRFKVSNLLSGIIVAFMLYSINLKVMQGVPNIVLMDATTIFTNNNVLLTLTGIVMIVLAILGYVLTTDFGLALRSVGQNKRLLLNGGVSLAIMTLTGLGISNALIALGGALFSQHQGFADVGSGVGTIIIGLASVMIGERLLPVRNIWLMLLACIAGSIIYRLVISLALHSDVLGLATQDLNLITGLLVVAIMLLPKRIARGAAC
jgi:putative ABC transport system permease protein